MNCQMINILHKEMMQKNIFYCILKYKKVFIKLYKSKWTKEETVLTYLSVFQNNHIQALQGFTEALGMFYTQCQQYTEELQKDLLRYVTS